MSMFEVFSVRGEELLHEYDKECTNVGVAMTHADQRLPEGEVVIRYKDAPHDKREWVRVEGDWAWGSHGERLPGAGMREHQAARSVQVGGSHYTDMAVQPWDALQAWMTPEQFIGYLRGSAITYLARCDAKGGLEDERKARHCLDRLIEEKENKS